MIYVAPADRSKIAAIVKLRTGVPTLEAFDMVDAILKALVGSGHSVLPQPLVRALEAAAVHTLDPVNGLLPMPDRSVLVPYLQERGWKAGEPWIR